MPVSQHTFVVYTFGPEDVIGQPSAFGVALPPEFSDGLLMTNLTLVWSDRTADEIRDAFQRSAGLSKILVVEAGNQAAWAGFNLIDEDWMLSRLSADP